MPGNESTGITYVLYHDIKYQEGGSHALGCSKRGAGQRWSLI